MSNREPELEVIDNAAEHRYEALLGGKRAGYVTYEALPGRIVFEHTEIDPAFEGHGVGGRLAAGVLDDARRRGLAVVAQCPFIAAYIERHPAYADLVAQDTSTGDT